MFWALDYACLALILAAAISVVAISNLNGAVMALSAMGTMLSVLFVVLGSPDDAHSEVVVGAIALPALYLSRSARRAPMCRTRGSSARRGAG